jgi:hypothetical protein
VKSNWGGVQERPHNVHDCARCVVACARWGERTGGEWGHWGCELKARTAVVNTLHDDVVESIRRRHRAQAGARGRGPGENGDGDRGGELEMRMVGSWRRGWWRGKDDDVIVILFSSSSRSSLSLSSRRDGTPLYRHRFRVGEGDSEGEPCKPGS